MAADIDCDDGEKEKEEREREREREDRFRADFSREEKRSSLKDLGRHAIIHAILGRRPNPCVVWT